ncbi:hypothetical protein ACWDVU_26700 [Streptomyces sp. NPDC003333]
MLELAERRVLICGSRRWPWPSAVGEVLDQLQGRYGDRLVVIEGSATARTPLHAAGAAAAGSVPTATGVTQSTGGLKQWRGIATRHDKQPGRYRAAITLASTLIWLDT